MRKWTLKVKIPEGEILQIVLTVQGQLIIREAAHYGRDELPETGTFHPRVKSLAELEDEIFSRRN